MIEVGKIMATHPAIIAFDCTLQEAAQVMRDQNTRVLPVGKNNKVIGIITDHDFTTRACAVGYDPISATVEEIMSEEPLTCRTDDDIRDAGSKMLSEQVGALLVKDRKGELAGIVLLSDIISYLGGADLVRYGPLNEFA